MIKILDYADLGRNPCLTDSMLRDRATQFIERHSWDLPLAKHGRERDEFDAPGTVYCVLEADTFHMASVRLRPASAGSMTERHFGPLWERFGPVLRDEWEVTRLLLAPGKAPKGAIGELLIGLCALCLERDIPTFFGVVFPSVARTLTRAGWPPLVLGDMTRGSESLLLCRWEATHLVHWTLQARHEDMLERRNQAAAAMAA